MAETMEPRLSLPHDQLDAFCQRWGVSEIYAFGSVTRPDFGPDSDVDVVVRFAPERIYSLFDLDAMREELEAMLGRRVDLLTLHGVEHMPNAARRQDILESMQLIHAVAEDDGYQQAQRRALSLLEQGLHLGGWIESTRNEWHER